MTAIGIYQSSTGSWYFDVNNDGIYTTGIDKEYQFGTPGFKPIIGNWNGDGRITIGVTNGQQWYLDWNGNGVWDAGTDKAYNFGATGWTPVLGDWNATGKSCIGVTNGQQWYLDWNGDGVWDAGTDKAYNFGSSGWAPVLGDWNATGKSCIGVTNGQQWYLDWNGNGVWDAGTDKAYNFGATGWTPVLGDWNGDGKTEIGVTNGQQWYLDWNGNGIWDAGTDKAYNFGATGWTPIIGDWNDDGRNKVGVYKDGTWYLDYLGEGSWTANGKEFQFGAPEWTPIIVTIMKPAAAFTVDKMSGTSPLTVTFTDKSTGTRPLSYAWDFDNDGTVDNTTQNPSFTYTTTGTYSVKLTVTNDAGSNATQKTSCITVTPASVAPTVAFISNKQSGTAPLTVTFTDQSTGTAPLTYAWDFNNDGVNDSTSKSPSFTYATTGTYSVKLTVKNTVGRDAELKTDYITVNEAHPGSTHAGLALTFDDNAVTNWYAIQDLLKKYNAHVTFFVSSFGGRSVDEINMLKTMKENGHEIAFHGAHHTDVNEYLSNHSIDEYFNYEIIPGIGLMKNAGLNPVDFAYPYGSENGAVTAVLEKYFTHIRGTAYHESGKLKDVDSVFYEYGSNKQHIYAIGIDDITYGNSLEDIYDGILRAKDEDKILILYAHTPVESDPQLYQTSYDRLEKILINASENNLSFYKIYEIN